MLTDIKSGTQLIILLLFIAAMGYVASQVIPAITQAFTIPARIKAENDGIINKNTLDNAQVGAQVAAIPTMVYLTVRATEQAIQNEKVQAEAQANAQVIEARGKADLNHSMGQFLLNTVVAVFSVIGLLLLLRFARSLMSVKQTMAQIEKRGGGVSILPSGEVRYFEPRISDHSVAPEPSFVGQEPQIAFLEKEKVA